MSFLKGKQVGEFNTVKFVQQSTPPALVSGESAIYIKNDGKVYKKIGTNTEVIIESASLTPSLVKSLYESNSNTNAFTDAYKNQLDSLTAGSKPEYYLFDSSFNQTSFVPVLDYTFPEGVSKSVKLDLREINVDTNNNVDLFIRFFVNETLNTNNTYKYHCQTLFSDGSNYNAQNNGTSQGQLTFGQGYGLNTSINNPFSMILDIQNIGSVTETPKVETTGVTWQGSYALHHRGHIILSELVKISGIRLYTTSGNLKGKISLYNKNTIFSEVSEPVSIYQVYQVSDPYQVSVSTAKNAKVLSFGTMA